MRAVAATTKSATRSLSGLSCHSRCHSQTVGPHRPDTDDELARTEAELLYTLALAA
jgi:hypothetical protein